MGKKERCTAISSSGRRCRKAATHTQTESAPLHNNDAIFWQDYSTPLPRRAKGLTSDRVVFDEAAELEAWQFRALNQASRGDHERKTVAPQHKPIDLTDLVVDISWTPDSRFYGVVPSAIGFTEPEETCGCLDRTEKLKVYREAAKAAIDRVRAANQASQPDRTPVEEWARNAVLHSMCTEACGPNCDAPRGSQESVSAEAGDPVTASPEHQLTEWWMQQAEDEIARTVPKAIEYSATDLADIGHDLARAMGRAVSDREAAELGVFFYLRGKMSRWVGAVIAGRQVSDDTLFDIGVYVRMAQRIRDVGSWPGAESLPDPSGVFAAVDKVTKTIPQPVWDAAMDNCGRPECTSCNQPRYPGRSAG